MKSGEIRAVRRKAISSDQRDLVVIGKLLGEHAAPIEIQPSSPGIRLNGWASSNRDYIEELLLRHRALLFRGFPPVSVEGFSKFVDLTTTAERLAYVDRTTPRTTKGDRIYTSTIHPADQRINPHNEGTYWIRWPARLYLACLTPADSGGETPIGDVRRVLSRIPDQIKKEFVAKQWQLVRNFNDGFGLRWQDVFQTDRRAEVETYCKENNINFEWKDGDRLRTCQVRPAIRQHPTTGEDLWFNHAAFFHYTSLEEPIRSALLEEFGESGLPYSTCFGDGSPIHPDVAKQIMEAYDAEKIKFPWQRGDILLLDNMTMYHSREPFSGSRNVVVAMTDAVSTTSSSSCPI